MRKSSVARSEGGPREARLKKIRYKVIERVTRSATERELEERRTARSAAIQISTPERSVAIKKIRMVQSECGIGDELFL